MNKKNCRLPRLAVWILARMEKYENEFSITGDCSEEFREVALEKGKTRALCWAWGQIITAIPSYFKSALSLGGVMFLNHLRIAFRIFKRAKLYALINTLGLAIGLACCILAFFYIQYELSYDDYHKNAEQIYRIIRDEPENLPRGGTTMENVCPFALSAALKEDFSEVRNIVRLRRDSVSMQFKDMFIPEDKFFYVDQEIFAIFDFPFISGDPNTALKEPFSLVITRTAAEKYFGNSNPVGKSITYIFDFMGSKKEHVLKITGVLEDIPKNSHFTFDFLSSIQTLLRIHDERLFGWGDGIGFKTYVMLDEQADPRNLEGEFTEILQKNSPPPYENNVLYLQPLTSIHLGGNIQNEIETNSKMGNIYMFSAIALLIMIIACFNYMNLSTARSMSRSREIGIRKVIGAERKNLVRQFIGEAFLFSKFALMIAVVFVLLFLPEFNALIDRSIDLRALDLRALLLGIMIITVGVTILSGSYPALFLSSFDPIKVLKKSHASGSNKGLGFRNLLVTLQFAISIALIIAALLVTKQLHFIKEKNLGFAKEHVVVLQGSSGLTRQYDAFKAELTKNPNILSAALTSGTPASTGSVGGVDWEGEKPGDSILWYNFCVDCDFMETLGLEMAAGRFFSKDFSGDMTNYVLNETAVKALGWQDPLGKTFSVWRRPGEVIGIVKDFHFRSLHDKILPLVLRIEPEYRLLYDTILIRLSSENVSPTLSYIEKTFREFDPQSPFVFSFLDEEIDKFYHKEKKFVQTFNYFSFLAVFVACLGVFGLLSYTIEQKTKEIGIRKVLGADVPKIVRLLTRELLKCVLLANIIAWPVAYWLMKGWLHSFAYRVNLGFEMFILSSTMTLLIAMITVSYKTVKAAKANPADSLRCE